MASAETSLSAGTSKSDKMDRLRNLQLRMVSFIINMINELFTLNDQIIAANTLSQVHSQGYLQDEVCNIMNTSHVETQFCNFDIFGKF